MGTPTMGGLLILIPTALVTALLNLRGRYSMLLPLGALLAFGALGALDDVKGLTNDKDAPLAPELGILARSMFVMQTGVATLIAAALYWLLDLSGVAIPGVGRVVSLGLAYLPLAVFVIVATVNGVNLTDGLDGLAGGTCSIAFAFYGVIAHLQGQSYLAGFCFTLVGALLAFLWHNVHPAAVFMGGVGSLALGATLALVALMTQQWLILPVIGAILVAENLSSTLQVGYFKYTRRRFGQGRRLFRMAPLHHHFEMLGWSEVQITQRFWIAGLIAGMLGLILAIW